jgi:selenocysteine lyase/cysteine desulfurase
MNRRDLFSRSAAAMLGAASAGAAPSLPTVSLREKDPERYWLKIRKDQFYLPEWRAFLNTGSLGVAPRPVVQAVTAFQELDASRAPDDYPRWGYETLDEERAGMAGFSGCKRDELAFTHNATEGLSMVAAGLDLKAGDEVVMTHLEHPSGRSPWQRRAQRDGVVVREVQLPVPPKNPEQVADLMVSAIGPRTRVLMFSGIISPTGWVMPIREICTAARAKGVLTLVDGAHMSGQIPFRLDQLNCDFWVGSPHKWLFAPAGCGLLYIREENLDRLWPTIVTGGWDDKSLKAARFMKVGTNNKALMMGMMAGLRFHQAIGSEAIFARVHELARRNRAMAAQRSFLKVITPDDDRMYGSLVTIDFGKRDMDKFWARIRERKIWTLVAPRLRISTHIHTRMSDLELFYKTVDEHFA